MDVLIIQSHIKQYRAPFFEQLHASLKRRGVNLRVGYGDPSPAEIGKNDSCDLPSDYGVKVRSYWGFGNHVLWQPLWKEVGSADLVIVEQANKYVMNQFLLVCSALGIKKVAYWGHGLNRQAQRGGFSEWLKKQTLNWVDWWFAYTAGTADYLIRNGVPGEKITKVQNAVDTSIFREQLATVSDSDLAAARKQLGVPPEAKVGLFCGGIIREKMPEFVVEAAVQIKTRLPEFEFLALGSGPERMQFERAAARFPWFHYLGPRFGTEKALYFRMADVFLMPGLVGLAILDAFAAAIPLMTTDVPLHSPEIEYLEHGRNGLMTSYAAGSFVGEVTRVLTDPDTLAALKKGAWDSAGKYSLDGMVQNFADGVLCCLGSTNLRWPGNRT